MKSEKLYIIRPAKPIEATALTKLSYRAKAYWGYPKEWLEAWKEELTVTPSMIEESISYVAEFREEIVGFWCRSIGNTDKVSFGLLSVAPEHMGNGCGRLLWEAIKEEACKRGINHFIIEADPNAIPFYLKIGGKQIGVQESKVIPGRILPIFRFELSER